MNILRHVLIFVVAVALTAAGFEFWGRMGHAMGVVLGMPVKSTPAPPPSGPVYVDILPAQPVVPAKPNCPKGSKPCK